ncbi:hypothetical protein GPECTOR_8g361 [Gonium pectorale]|uniref:SRCR domain-containing protein n=1 Tax=Gonium pectorale TaxID=33097 RepID=A0A150GT61_GONPE|nr:hypothetical protein GPECTOR_8g361 [Gonium pectorale]|eukprot:KXZ52991.1 hypothetical protein GPECTOR_8g361 [Gonium pectorale]
MTRQSMAQPYTPYPVRLAGGPTEQSGRLEVLYSGVWGTVCNNYFGDREATVACNMLGYWWGTYYLTYSQDPNTMPVWMDYVQCYPVDGALPASLHECSFNGWGVTSCSHYYDIHVACYDGRLRLVGGDGWSYGTVMVFRAGQWGTIMDNYWDWRDAGVVCSGPVWLSGVECNWDEKALTDCRHSGWSGNWNSGQHNLDAGVRCFNATSGPRVPSDGSLRLVGRNAPAGSGTLEIWYNGAWGTIHSDQRWLWTNAVVACRQLGWSTGSAVSLGFLGGGSESQVVWLGGVSCSGAERRLIDCTNGGLYARSSASRMYDVGVICSNETNREGDIRLVGPQASSGYGVIEVWTAGVWASIYVDTYYYRNGLPGAARVACRQLGWNSGIFAKGPVVNGSASLVTFEFRLGCGAGLWNSSSARLMDCLAEPVRGYANWGDGHTSDFGVSCFNEPDPRQGTIRLLPDPDNPIEGAGALQLWYSGTWGYLQIENWNWAGALAACRELGYNSGRPLRGAVMGLATGPTWYGYVSCSGTEAKLWDCISASQENEGRDFWLNSDPTDHTYDTGVHCYNESLPPRGRLRLARGQRAGEGQLEVFLDTWTVLTVNPSDPGSRLYFSPRDAIVACRQLGYPTGRFIIRSPQLGMEPPLWMPKTALWSPRNGWYASFGCAGNEASLFECANLVAQQNRVRLGTPPDSRYAPVTVRCANLTEDPEPAQGSLRLVGGPVAWIGRLEIFNEGAWGTICRASQAAWRVSFGIKQARVACRQLGYRGGRVYGALLTGAGRLFQPDRQPSWLRDIECSGSEARLDACSIQSGFDENTCWGGGFMNSHDNDVVIACEPKAVAGVPEPAAGAVRLAGGPNAWSGRVEVFYDGLWGTIGRVTANEARVICTQLGLTGGRPADAKYTYGTESGPVWLSGFSCQGTETNVTQCSNIVWDGEAASHDYDAAVMCYPPAGAIVAEYTLAAGSQDAGRLGTWQEWRFCPYGSFVAAAHVQALYTWNEPDATGVTSLAVYCFQDGVMSTELIPPIKDSGSRSHYWLGPYGCSPTPGNASVPWSFVGARLRVQNNNGAGDDAAVTGIEFLCSNNLTAPIQSEPISDADGQCDDVGVTGLRISCCKITRDHYPGPGRSVRLFGGSSPMDGRVEFLGSETWNISTIYQDYWTLNDAKVLCRQLGATHGYPTYATQNGFGVNDVTPDYFWPWGYDYERGIASRSYFYQCTGAEASLADCPHYDLVTSANSNAAGAVCRTDLEPEYGSVRLVDGPAPYAGRVEFYADGAWQAIRANDDTQLGFGSALRPVRLASTWWAWAGPTSYIGVVPVNLGSVECNGSEPKITDCPAQSLSSSDAGSGVYTDHQYDAGVVCQTAAAPSPGALRLRDSLLPSEGRIELYWDFAWGTLAYKSGQPTYMSGWGHFTDAVSASEFYTTRYSVLAPNWLAGGFTCTGSEWAVGECPDFNPQFAYSTIDGYGRAYDVGVLCSMDLPPATGTIRLTGGPEVAYRNEWGSVLGISGVAWGGKESLVACRRMGFQGVASYWTSDEPYNPGWVSGMDWLTRSYTAFLYNISCLGTEASLAQCENGNSYVVVGSDPIYTPDWRRFSHVYLMCSEAPNPPLGSLRLVGGPAPNIGTLEVFSDDYRWRPVVQGFAYGGESRQSWRSFGEEEAGVACKQLGFMSPSGVDQKAVVLDGNGFMPTTAKPATAIAQTAEPKSS